MKKITFTIDVSEEGAEENGDAVFAVNVDAVKEGENCNFGFFVSKFLEMPEVGSNDFDNYVNGDGIDGFQEVNYPTTLSTYYEDEDEDDDIAYENEKAVEIAFDNFRDELEKAVREQINEFYPD